MLGAEYGCESMRRWVILFLLVLNAAFFVWLYQQQQLKPGVADVLTVPEGAETLTLLSEYNRSREEVLVSQPQQARSEDQLSSEELIRRFKSGQLGSSVSASAVDKEMDGSLELSEKEVCWKLGPFVEELSSKQLAYRLKAAGISFVEIKEPVLQPPLWWVYLPSFESRDQALQMLRRLQIDKIDSFLVASGEFKHAISLGFFSKQETAEAVLRDAQKQGYMAKVVEKPRSQLASWFVLSPAAASGDWLELEQSLFAANPELKKIKNSCKSIALSE